MNYCNFIVKIVEKPIQRYFKNDILVIEIGVQISQIRDKKNLQTLRILFWGDLGHDILKYYQINDYIVIEGYISLCQKISKSEKFQTKNQVQISIRKIYPLNLK